MEFWFEFASTYSYPAAMRVERLTRAAGVPLVWRTFLLGPIFKSQGWSDSPFNLLPVKGRYMWRDLERISDADGIGFRRPSAFPRSSLVAARIACRYHDEPWLPEFVRRVYQANFADDRDISDKTVIADCLSHAGADAQSVLAVAETDEAKAQLRRQTEKAATLGIFGAPTFVVDGELFWGNDRLEQALAWYAAAR